MLKPDAKQFNTGIPSIIVHPTHIVTMFRTTHVKSPMLQVESSAANLKRNYMRNELSALSTRKIKRSINYMLINSQSKHNYSQLNWKNLQFNLTFVTLTLSSAQMHTENWIKTNMLHQFIVEAHNHWEVQNYVWRSEKQKNGSVHFHFICDKFIPWQELRAVWNRIQQKAGYIAEYRKNMLEFHQGSFRVRYDLLSSWPILQQRKAYGIGIKTNWSNPNSTDIHSVRLVRNVASYLCKYMSKVTAVSHPQISRTLLGKKKPLPGNTSSTSDGARRFLKALSQRGRQWACSYSLANIKGAKDDIDSKVSDELKILRDSGKFKIIDEKYYNCFCVTLQDLIKLHCISLIQLFSEFMVDQFILKGS